MTAMRRVFKTRHFARWMRTTELTDSALAWQSSKWRLALWTPGGGVVKKRIALPGRGKSAGARTLVATNKGGRWFFVFGFEKSERANISAKELEALQRIAADLLALGANGLDMHLAQAALKEICHDN